MSIKKHLHHFQAMIATLALLVAIIALILSWQANQIASIHTTPKIAVVSVGVPEPPYILQNYPPREQVECQFRLTIVNYGGASAALLNYSALVLFGEKTVFIPNPEYPSNVLEPAISNIQLYIKQNRLPTGTLGRRVFETDIDDALVLPHNIAEFSGESLDGIATFWYDSSKYKGTRDEPYDLGDQTKDWHPVNISYILHIAAQQDVNSSPTLCYSLRPR